MKNPLSEKRKKLTKQLIVESKLVRNESMKILAEHEQQGDFWDELPDHVKQDSDILRVHLKKGESNVISNCDIMVDQLRAIDNKRLIKRTGKLTEKKIVQLTENLKILLDLE